MLNLSPVHVLASPIRLPVIAGVHLHSPCILRGTSPNFVTQSNFLISSLALSTSVTNGKHCWNFAASKKLHFTMNEGRKGWIQGSKVRVPSEKSEIARSVFALLFRLQTLDALVVHRPYFSPLCSGQLTLPANCPKLNFRSVARLSRSRNRCCTVRAVKRVLDESSPSSALIY